MANIKVTSTRAFDSANELNAQARRTLGLGEHNAMKVAGMRFSREVDDFSFEIVRLHDGKFIMRLLAKESTSGKQLKGHLELNLADEAELIDLLNKDQFWSGDYMRKLSQFVGYVGEAHVMRKLAGNPPKMTAYKPTRGNKAAEAIEYEFKPGTIMSLQKPGGEQVTSDKTEDWSEWARALCDMHLDIVSLDLDDEPPGLGYEFDKLYFALWPVDIHAAMRVRRDLGLDAPAPDHPLMREPLAEIGNMICPDTPSERLPWYALFVEAITAKNARFHYLK